MPTAQLSRPVRRETRLAVSVAHVDGVLCSEPELPVPGCLASLVRGAEAEIEITVAVAFDRRESDRSHKVTSMSIDGVEVPDHVRKCICEGEWHNAIDLLAFEATAE